MLPRAFRIQVDIGFGDAITPLPENILFPTMLGMPAPVLKSYPRETVIAEKFQAMVILGIANSRMKDFFDLFTLCSQYEFDGGLVCRAIKATFDRRNTSIPLSPPLALTPEFAEDKQKSTQWNAFLHKSKLDGRGLKLGEVAQRLEEFLMPPADAASCGSVFDKVWKPFTGWQSKK